MINAGKYLIIMACSATKLERPARAFDLYQGVMYSTFRANVSRVARPEVMILSARHGFVCADTVIAPYEQRMTAERANAMLSDLPSYLCEGWPAQARNVLLVGGKEYRRVMRAAVSHLSRTGRVASDASVDETSGGIGYQRSQLGAYLRAIAKSDGHVVGFHQNGQPLYRRLGAYVVGDTVQVVYRARPDLPARPARIEELFDGPRGDTASIAMLDVKPGAPAQSWIALADLQPINA
ncbi:DUF6884 domain-containing protein [Paraburkholderia aspalathi]|uniref:DUF6884 domain-containing protein n=1 Tax=Paraburkholderia aspalathi TaxID=1324617 RepID=UPI001B0A3E6B|nr:DUF6884 domain-containing protein [Paraburkholderia aspalathi]CAE6843568.1 hypothetical protein R20943_07234 [Paraburkholderia aspalathi]